jgi:hypothetical protein
VQVFLPVLASLPAHLASSAAAAGRIREELERRGVREEQELERGKRGAREGKRGAREGQRGAGEELELERVREGQERS